MAPPPEHQDTQCKLQWRIWKCDRSVIEERWTSSIWIRETVCVADDWFDEFFSKLPLNPNANGGVFLIENAPKIIIGSNIWAKFAVAQSIENQKGGRQHTPHTCQNKNKQGPWRNKNVISATRRFQLQFIGQSVADVRRFTLYQ